MSIFKFKTLLWIVFFILFFQRDVLACPVFADDFYTFGSEKNNKYIGKYKHLEHSSGPSSKNNKLRKNHVIRNGKVNFH